MECSLMVCIPQTVHESPNCIPFLALTISYYTSFITPKFLIMDICFNPNNEDIKRDKDVLKTPLHSLEPSPYSHWFHFCDVVCFNIFFWMMQLMIVYWDTSINRSKLNHRKVFKNVYFSLSFVNGTCHNTMQYCPIIVYSIRPC